MPAKHNRAVSEGEREGERMALARLIVTGLIIDQKWVLLMKGLPTQMLVEIKNNLGLKSLRECDGVNPAEEMHDFNTALRRCQEHIQTLKHLGG